MELKKLILNNFQRIKYIELDFKKNTTIKGDNATGKTTIANAITWLLFDQSSQGTKNFNPKTIGKDGEQHNLEHSVEAIFYDENLNAISFKKVFKEVYKKKRGSVNSEFSGHTTDYFIDNVPKKQKDFDLAIEDIFNINKEKIKQLMTPFYFPETMSWQDRRKLLLDICGDINDIDILAAMENENAEDGELLKDELNGRSVEDMIKVLSSTKSMINKDLQSLPERIDELNKTLADVGVSQAKIKNDIKEKESLIDDLTDRLNSLKDVYVSTALEQAALIEAENAYKQARYAFDEKERNKNNELNSTINSLKDVRMQKSRDYTNNSTELERLKNKLANMQELKTKLYEEHKRVSSVSWNKDEAVCPACHQTLPESDVEALKTKFNIDKSNKLEAIIERGKKECSSQMIKNLEANIKALEDAVLQQVNDFTALEQHIEDKEKERIEVISFETTEKHNRLKNIVLEARNRLENAKRGNDTQSEQSKTIEAEMLGVKEQIRGLEQMNFALENNKLIKKRIKELEASEENLAKEYEHAEHILHLCELFIRKKVSLLTDNINKHFKTCRFRLFSEQINGGVKEECEVLIPCGDSLIPYSVANNASRINAGLEIIGVLNKHYKTNVPIIVDNAESVTKLIDVDNQIIKLVVDEDYKQLTLG